MAPRTLSEVQDALDSSLAWRRIEMSALVAAMEASSMKSEASPLSRALARSCTAMIYAHWEGFVKESCQCYVDYVARRRLRFHELNDGFLKTALTVLLKRVAAGDETGTAALLDVVRRPGEARAQIPKNSMVDTKANLRYATLCDILGATGLSVSRFETKANLIDRSLCDTRNSIAHGRDLFPLVEDVQALHREVLAMMTELRTLIMDAAREKSYRVGGS